MKVLVVLAVVFVIGVAAEQALPTSQYHIDNDQHTLVVQGHVIGQKILDYCRFMRTDGLEFTTANLPAGYEDHSLKSSGLCEIRINDPSTLDQNSWTVATRAVGESQELVGRTEYTIYSTPEEEDSEDEDDDSCGGRPNRPNRPHRPASRSDKTGWIWFTNIFVLVTMSGAYFAVGWLLAERRNRKPVPTN